MWKLYARVVMQTTEYFVNTPGKNAFDIALQMFAIIVQLIFMFYFWQSLKYQQNIARNQESICIFLK